MKKEPIPITDQSDVTQSEVPSSSSNSSSSDSSDAAEGNVPVSEREKLKEESKIRKRAKQRTLTVLQYKEARTIENTTHSMRLVASDIDAKKVRAFS